MDTPEVKAQSRGKVSSSQDQDAFSSMSSNISPVKLDGRQDDALMTDPFQQTAVTTTTEHNEREPSSIVLGEFSFAPTTETTVYTTKVVKTVNFPPLIMKGPKHLHDLDPKLYPLAASPTPPALKKFVFDVDGKPTVFREAEDPEVTLQQIREQNQSLKANGGKISSRKEYGAHLETPQRSGSGLSGYLQVQGKASEPEASESPIRGASGVRTRSGQFPSRKATTVARRVASTSQSDFPRPSKSSSRLQYVQTSTPITPSLGARNDNESKEEDRSRAGDSIGSISSPANTITPETQSREFRQTLSPRPEVRMERSFTDDSFSSNSMDEIVESSTATPLDSQNTLQGNRPRPTTLDTTIAQDASLPSPSLSPVTAAANLQSRRGYFDDASNLNRRVACTDMDEPHGLGLFGQESSQTFALSQQTSQSSLMGIPRMLDSFGAMPLDMQRYVMFQLLRRCPKPVLHSVAEVVNPALKCDFLSLLPAELGHIVIGNLDLKSLCRAAQVSKKWRHIVDSDEKVWKDLFDGAGYKLGAEELRRSVLEGWGWQPWSNMQSSEEDIGKLEASAAEEHPSPTLSNESSPNTSTLTDLLSSSSSTRQSKRKANVKLRTSTRKVPKKKQTSTDDVAFYDVSALSRHINNAEGPYAAAQVAGAAIARSEIGLQSLRNLTLHKNIYRRHHLISEAWMQDEVKPRHLAFKAHSRHVVTCLQFDSNKILTGSDDTNINVYDTETGALRAKLTGHEGGVWALQYVGNTLVSGSTDRSVRVWDIERGVCTHVFHGHTSTVRCLIILMPTVIGKTSTGKPIMMPKEPIIITGSRDSTLRVWKLPKSTDPPPRTPADDVESPYLARTLTGHTHSVRAIAAHGDTLVSGSYDYSVRVWKISTGDTVHRLTGHTQKVYSVVLDHERNRCISGSMDNLVKIWSLETGSVLFNLEGHNSLVGLLDLQRDRLVSAAADSTLRIWDPEHGQCEHTLSAHTGAITCFQHDGNKVVSGSDRNLKMWNIKNGRFVRDLLTDLSGVWQVNFDERRCVAAVQRSELTYIEILDFGASRDGVPESQRGRRIVVDALGHEIAADSEAGDEPED